MILTQNMFLLYIHILIHITSNNIIFYGKIKNVDISIRIIRTSKFLAEVLITSTTSSFSLASDYSAESRGRLGQGGYLLVIFLLPHLQISFIRSFECRTPPRRCYICTYLIVYLCLGVPI